MMPASDAMMIAMVIRAGDDAASVGPLSDDHPLSSDSSLGLGADSEPRAGAAGPRSHWNDLPFYYQIHNGRGCEWMRNGTCFHNVLTSRDDICSVSVQSLRVQSI